MEDISWKLIDKYFLDNPYNLVAHHLDSYNDFFSHGINQIFRENNPIRFIERGEDDADGDEKRNQSLLYLGGKDGNKIYFGKPIIYDDMDRNAHYMYPNDARLRNMTYGVSIHYDVDVDFIFFDETTGEKKTHSITLDNIYLGRFPIMLQSNLCILGTLAPDVRFNMGECRNDYGGYFIIDGKEKSIISQEKFANNMLYIRQNKADDTYSYSAEVRSVSEDASKPIRTTAVKIVAPSPSYSNNQIVVAIPNVKEPMPLFIVMRALGVISDKKIIEYCLLDMKNNESYVDLFIPSIHDASKIFTQKVALRFISKFTKRRTITGVLDILMNYFLPHIGEDNFLEKAYYIGYMANRILHVFTKDEKPTDRDNFRFKRVELSGTLIYDLFREYFLIQNRNIGQKIDKEHYFHKGKGKYKDNFFSLIEDNYHEFFKERIVESGVKKAFKGNWGSESHTKRVGVVQDLNRLSWNTFISQLRKINLPLDASAKVVGPRLLNSSQWGYIDPVDTPDGANIGLHKHMAISAQITSGFSGAPLVRWLRAKTAIKILQECDPHYLSLNTKVWVNGVWIGVINNPLETVKLLKTFRRSGLIPFQTSISFQIDRNEVHIFTDSGRLIRPVFYIEDGKPSFQRKEVLDIINSGKFTWQQIVTGFKAKPEDFSLRYPVLYDLNELYPEFKAESLDAVEKNLNENRALVDYLDVAEEEGLLIATTLDDLAKNKYYTNLEINSSFLFGVMGNLVIYPEHNPLPRNSFSCGQSKQAVSVYHTNYQSRIDKMGVILNYGQIPILKSRYLDYVNKEEQPYGVNAIVAIMSFTGYNVEDAILINEGAIKRGLFLTTYYSMYEAREESTKVQGSMNNSVFTDIASRGNVAGIKPGYDYSHLDKYGIIRENTPLDDKMVLIGKTTTNSEDSEVSIDGSVFPKKGQLGFVDKSFITEGEEGFRIAKVRVREERMPAIGDKMASRAGQKGTLGLIIPEEDMPFTADGVRPDLIINPHALPSRMTIGQLIESLFGKACVTYGGFGDCTAFQTKGPNTEVYGKMLVEQGFHSSGNQILYNGMSGQQLYSEIFIGPTYYMRLKHMVKDKINYRARGPRTVLTRQTVQGRANDGGLRIGEMERDGILAHGASAFLNESFLVRGDEYYMAVCNKTGCIAVYNKALNIFLSPFADGPIKFNTTLDGKMNVENVSKFGRSFSIVRIPYALKLMIHELQVLNVQMRIITEDNIDQLMNMSYSNNVNQLLKNDDPNMVALIGQITKEMTELKRYVKQDNIIPKNETPEFPTFGEEYHEATTSPEYATGSPAYRSPYDSDVLTPEVQEGNSPKYNPNASSSSSPISPGSPADATGSPAYQSPYLTPEVNQGNSPKYNPNSPVYNPNSPVYNPNSPVYNPNSPVYNPNSPVYNPNSPVYNPLSSDEKIGPRTPPIRNPEVKAQFEALPERDKVLLQHMLAEKRQELSKESAIEAIKSQEEAKAQSKSEEKQRTAILDIETEKKEEIPELESGSDSKSKSSSSGTKKVVLFDLKENMK